MALIANADYFIWSLQQLLHHDLWLVVTTLYAVCLNVYANFLYAFYFVVALWSCWILLVASQLRQFFELIHSDAACVIHFAD